MNCNIPMKIDQGGFKLDASQSRGDGVLYIVAKGGTPKVPASRGLNDAIALLAVRSTPPQPSGERIHHVGVGVDIGAISGG